jgi:hypothetical protein
MLNLSVSAQPCVPGRALPVADGKRPARCETCGAPGGNGGVLLEGHYIGSKKVKYLCPLCHSCLHLDIAGRNKAGRIIWLPELSQEQLNLMCLAMFVAFGKAGVYRNNEETKGVLDSSLRLYNAFERRAESMELFLGGSAVKSLMPRQSLSSPTHIASLLMRVQRDGKLKPRELAARVDGMRLLPAPKAFADYINKVSRIVTAEYAVPSWSARVNEVLAARDASDASGLESHAHFDAETIAG